MDECATADIDFEFIIDSSISMGRHNWQKTMDLIAKYWIQGAIRPNGSPECGNHVAARSYSVWFLPQKNHLITVVGEKWLSLEGQSFVHHFCQLLYNEFKASKKPFEVGSHRFLDFAPPSLDTYQSSYSDYVSSIFKKEKWIARGTQTAGALNRKTVSYMSDKKSLK